MANLVEIQAKIDALKAQAETIRTKEFASTLAEIRAKMAAYGITVKDLQTPVSKANRKARASTAKATKAKSSKGVKTGSKVDAKYVGPNGEAWSGRGLTPKWLAVLVEQGRSKSEFAIAARANLSAESAQT